MNLWFWLLIILIRLIKNAEIKVLVIKMFVSLSLLNKLGFNFLWLNVWLRLFSLRLEEIGEFIVYLFLKVRMHHFLSLFGLDNSVENILEVSLRRLRSNDREICLRPAEVENGHV